MKKYSYILLLATLMFACDNKLDVKPQQSVSSDVALSNSDNVVNVLISAYSEMGGQFGTASDGRPEGGELSGADYNLFSELMGSDGEITWNGTFDTYEDVFDKDMIDNNALARDNWMRGYNVINIANTVLDNIETVDEDIRNQVQGEALWIRANTMFELVRIYALPYESGQTNSQLGIPIVLKGTTEITDESKVSRNTVEEVYSQVIADLVLAESLMDDRNGFFANTFVASATLSRVYLQQENYSDALAAADRVIQDGGYILVPDYAGAFNNQSDSPEDIFAIQQDATFNAGTSNSGLPTFYANLPGVGRDGDIDILPAHLALYEAEDERLTLFYEGLDGQPKTGKWAVDGANIPVIRLAEMYLTRAECNLRLGSSVGASPVDDINVIRDRAGVSAVGSLTLDFILEERRRELAFEGHRLHDLKRNKLDVDGFPYNADDMVFPIPRRETDANENLEQNPGY